MDDEFFESLIHNHIVGSFGKVALEDNDLVATSFVTVYPPKSSRIVYKYCTIIRDIPFNNEEIFSDPEETVFVNCDKNYFVKILSEVLNIEDNEKLNQLFKMVDRIADNYTQRYIILNKKKLFNNFHEDLKSAQKLLEVVNENKHIRDEERDNFIKVLLKINLEESLENKKSKIKTKV